MKNHANIAHQAPLADLILVSAQDLAQLFGFAGANDAFRSWCKRCGIEPLPGRRSHFDPKLVRLRLNEIQGHSDQVANDKPLSLVEQRRSRLATC